MPTAGTKASRGPPLDDEYMLYTYKVLPCSRVSTHNWKLCHFSHVGEVAARRRHPSCHAADLCAYVSANKECPLGDSCPYAHNSFESWLHPDRYKTTLCSYGGACTRRFCFFAHSAGELRTPAKLHQVRLGTTLAKTSSLDTNASVGTPNSSSSSNSNATLHSLLPSWTPGSVAAGSPSSLGAGLCLQQAAMDGSAAGRQHGGLGAQQQGLAHLVVSAPPLASAAALAAPAAQDAAGLQQLWDLAALGVPGLLPADGSGFGCDPASPATPMSMGGPAAGVHGGSPLGMQQVCAPAAPASQQQDLGDAGLRQVLQQQLQELLQQVAAGAALTPEQQQVASLLLQPQAAPTPASSQPLHLLSGALAGSAGACWVLPPQQQLQGYPSNMQAVLQAGQLPVGFSASVASAGPHGSSYAPMVTDAAQLQQQLNMLTFAMAQPA